MNDQILNFLSIFLGVCAITMCFVAWLALWRALWRAFFPAAKEEGEFCPKCGHNWSEHSPYYPGAWNIRWCPVKMPKVEPPAPPRGGSGKTDAWAESMERLNKAVKKIENSRALHPAMVNNTARSIRDLQTTLPWTVHYSRDFRASPMAWKDFGHALLHVHKAGGKIAAMVNDAEHGGSDFKDVGKYIADLVVCALRLANTCPGRTIDLQSAVEERIANKNGTNPEIPQPPEAPENQERKM